MRPETWLPTCTVTSAESVPVAVTRATMRPWSTLTVSYLSAGLRWRAIDDEGADGDGDQDEDADEPDSSSFHDGAVSEGF